MDLAFFTGSAFRATIPLAAFEVLYPGCASERWVARIWREAASEAPPVFAWDSAAPPAAFPAGLATKIVGPSLVLEASSDEMLANFGPAGGSFVWDLGFYRASQPRNFVRVDGGSATCYPIDGGSIPTPAVPGDTVAVTGSNALGVG